MTKEKSKKILKGVVVSYKMAKTVVVRVDALKKHGKLQRFYKSSKRYKVHDPESKFKMGDVVKIQSSRPISKDKHWIVV